MAKFELNTRISVGEQYGTNPPNITLEDAKFFGRPNFSGDAEADRFGDPRRKFTVQIPNELADQLRALNYNVKTTDPTAEEIEQGREPISSLKVMVDNVKVNEAGDIIGGPNVRVIQGGQAERLTNRTMGIIDRSKIDNIDMEIRAWEYNPLEKPGEFSARVVTFVAVIRPNILAEKYGTLL